MSDDGETGGGAKGRRAVPWSGKKNPTGQEPGRVLEGCSEPELAAAAEGQGQTGKSEEEGGWLGDGDADE